MISSKVFADSRSRVAFLDAEVLGPKYGLPVTQVLDDPLIPRHAQRVEPATPLIACSRSDAVSHNKR